MNQVRPRTAIRDTSTGQATDVVIRVVSSTSFRDGFIRLSGAVIAAHSPFPPGSLPDTFSPTATNQRATHLTEGPWLRNFRRCFRKDFIAICCPNETR